MSDAELPVDEKRSEHALNTLSTVSTAVIESVVAVVTETDPVSAAGAALGSLPTVRVSEHNQAPTKALLSPDDDEEHAPARRPPMTARPGPKLRRANEPLKAVSSLRIMPQRYQRSGKWQSALST
jgi:hypothetical protein